MEALRLLRLVTSSRLSRCPWAAAAAGATIYFAAGLSGCLAGGAALVVLQVLGISYWPMVLAAGWLAGIAVGSGAWGAGLLALALLTEALAGYAILKLRRRPSIKFPALANLMLATVVTLAVPAVGATLMAAGSGPEQFFEHWRFWWGQHAAGFLVFAPFWTLVPRASRYGLPIAQSVSESLANLHHALAAFETSPRVIVTQAQPEPIHHL